jgi:hypothetical protein
MKKIIGIAVVLATCLVGGSAFAMAQAREAAPAKVCPLKATGSSGFHGSNTKCSKNPIKEIASKIDKLAKPACTKREQAAAAAM